MGRATGGAFVAYNPANLFGDRFSMPFNLSNGLRLFKVFGITVYLHWSWFVVAVYEIQLRSHAYSSVGWNIAEYLALFVIVLLHEFGHALACKSVGGKAERIMLWPLGGVAFVRPPPRAGAYLWSIVAGPLVNVVLLPLTLPFVLYSQPTDLGRLLYTVGMINVVLLVFNLLPIFPLDGGQILRGILWFFIGRGDSLLVASVIGIIGAVAVGVLALLSRNTWYVVMAALGLMQCWRGLTQARALRRFEALPRRANFACPACHAHPPGGPLWGCGACQTRFDTFEHQAICPGCGRNFSSTRCPSCGVSSPIANWEIAAPYITPAAQ
jgi:Zn-dependent protease